MELDRRDFGALGALGLLGAALAPSRALAQVPTVPEPVAALLTEAFGQDGGSAGAATVVRDGRLVGFWSHGFASIPFRTPITQRTLFQTGSVGKHVTALGVLRLVDAGRVALDAPVGNYVEGLQAGWASIPVRFLLQHVSGIPDYGEVLPDWDRPQTKAIVIERMAAMRPLFAPGEAWSYSNTNYLILGWLLEAVAGSSYAEFVASQLFRPAGLPHARADAAQEPIPDRAEPYEVREGGLRHAVRMENGVSAAADGGLLFAAADWAPWSAALEGRRLVSEQSWQAIHRPARLTSGREVNYGFGWHVDKTRGETYYSHSGGVPGFLTFVLRLPARRTTVVLTANLARRTIGSLLAFAVAEALHPGSTFYGLTEPEPILRVRAARARALLVEGRRDPELIAPELAVALRAAGRPAPRPVAMAAGDRLIPVESHAVAGGTIQRFRLEVRGKPQFRSIGWTEDNRAYLLA